MSETAMNMEMSLYASDAAGQRRYAINFPRTAKIRDLIKALIPQMGLSSKDTSGRPLDYQAFSKRSHCHLRGSETVGEALQSGDEISVLPDIQAG
jgi:hypothetical protein